MEQSPTAVPTRGFDLPILSPFAGLAVVILFIIVASHETGSDDTLPAIGYVLASLIWATGLVLGLRAFRKKTSISRKRFWLSILSLSLNVLFLCMGIVGLSVFTWMKVDAARMEHRAAESEANTLSAKTANPAIVQEELAKRAVSEFKWRLSELQKTCDSVARAMTNPPILDVSQIKTKQDLNERADLIAEYGTASMEMLQFCKNVPENFHRTLQRHKLTDQTRKNLEDEFWNNIKVVNPTVISLREADVRKSKLIGSIIALLQKDFGEWKYLSNADEIQFQNAKSRDEYIRLNSELKSLNSDIQKLQTELREQLKSSKTKTP